MLSAFFGLILGRMMGHSFIHVGPCVSGISPAIIHVLFGGSRETATIQIEDCPDIDIHSTIQLVCNLVPFILRNYHFTKC